jgi:APA family basic amino acid/polyamine antiporter
MAILLIGLLTFINTKGIRNGKIIQTVFTATKLLSLFGLIFFGFILAAKSEIWNANWAGAFTMKGWNAGTSNWPAITGTAMIGAVAAAMVGSIFSSDAWNNVTFIAGEVKNPKKNIGLALFFGTLIVTLIYVATNLMYVSVLPMNEIAFAENDRVAVTASHAIFGNAGTIVIAIMIMISTFGCNNGLILAGARVYNAMAIDKLFFKKAALLNKFAVPGYALWAQFVMASILCLSGKYGDLLDMISFVVVLFYAITIIGIFKLRKTKPDAERPYKAFGYPILPAIYIVLAFVFCIFLILFKPVYAGIGLGIVLAGIPVYYISVGSRKKE